VTWAKFGCEFDDEVASAGLSDAAHRTHSEAIKWLYRVERTDMRIPKRMLRHIAFSTDYERAIRDLIAAKFWRERGDAYQVLHHANVIRQSIRQQHDYAERNRRAQRAHRQREAEQHSKVSADISADVSAHTYIHTNSFPLPASTGVGGSTKASAQ
jgi:hypothetical protein